MRAPYDRNRSIGLLTKEISRLLERNFDARVRVHGLTHTQWQALATLARQQGIKQAELADSLEIQPISVARLVDRMEATGWVERRPDPHDRRVTRLFLTPRVDPILDEMAAAAIATRDTALDGLDAAEREHFFSLLNRVKANLARVAPPLLAAAAADTGKTTDETD